MQQLSMMELQCTLKASFSSSTRGVSAGGGSPDNRNILFITLASTGAQTDSGGDLSSNLLNYGTGVSNSTRGLICGGLAPGRKSEIEYVTIASLEILKILGI